MHAGKLSVCSQMYFGAIEHYLAHRKCSIDFCWMDRWTDGWMDGWTDGWIDRGIDGRMGGWMDGQMGG